MTDAHDIIRDAISSGRGSRPLAVCSTLFAAAGALEGEARIVLHRDANGTVRIEGQAIQLCEVDWEDDSAGYSWPVACNWSHDSVVLGSTDAGTPLFRVVPAGEATDE